MSTRQCGQAKYGSAFSSDRFMAFKGLAKRLPQDGFRHVYSSAGDSLFLSMIHSPLKMKRNAVYSVNASRIKSLDTDQKQAIALKAS